MQASYAPATSFTRIEEGPYSGDARDSGNWSSGITGHGELIGSMYGCGAPATIAYMARVQPGFVVTAAWMKALPAAVYDGMAVSAYWRPLQGDQLPAGLDLMCFDFGWNTGIGSAARRLQYVLGATQDGRIGPATLGLTATCDVLRLARLLGAAEVKQLQQILRLSQVDGICGPATLAALAAQPAARIAVIVLALSEAQAAYYRSLGNFSLYGKGWLARTARRTSAALTLAQGQPVSATRMRLAAAGRRLVGIRPAPAAIEPDSASGWMALHPHMPIRAQAGRLRTNAGVG